MEGHHERAVSRRAVLGASAATLAGTAGCSGLPPLGSRVNFGTVDAPGPGPPTYRRWIPEPSAAGTDTSFAEIEDGELQPSSVIWYGEPRAVVAADVPTTLDYPRGFLVPRLDFFGHGIDHYERAFLVANGTYVLEGDVDVESVAGTVTTSGYDRDGTHRGYDLFARSDLRRVLAASDDALVFGQGDAASADVRTLVDTAEGAIPRYHASDEAFATITDATGSRPWIMYGAGAFVGSSLADRVVASTVGTGFVGESVYFFFTNLFEDAGAVDRTAIKAAVRDGLFSQSSPGPLGPDTFTAEIEVDGPLVRIAAKFAVDDLVRTDGGNGRMPQITWGFEEASGRVTVRHEAGESVDASAVLLRLADSDGGGLNLQTQFDGQYGTVEPGDSLTVDADELADASTLRLVYDYETRSAVAATYEVSA